MLRADVLLFTEAKLTSTTDSLQLKVPSFEIADGNSSSSDPASNVASYFKSEGRRLEMCVRFKVQSQRAEICYYQIRINGTVSDYVHLLVVYRSPVHDNLSAFFLMLDNCLEEFKTSRFSDSTPLLLLGDFNIDLLKNSPERKALEDLLFAHHCHQLVREHTSDYGSLLDHVWTNLPPSDVRVQLLDTYWSDHVPVSVQLRL